MVSVYISGPHSWKKKLTALSRCQPRALAEAQRAGRGWSSLEVNRPPLGPRVGVVAFLSLSLSLLHFCDSNDELMLPRFSLLLHNSPTKGGSATLLVSGR